VVLVVADLPQVQTVDLEDRVEVDLTGLYLVEQVELEIE
jgi:hypothetical protein